MQDAKRKTGGWRRFGLGAVLIAAGIVWSVLFPKEMSLDPDMVASVAIAIGLLGPGLLLWLEPRIGRAVTALAILLLWSLLFNVVQSMEGRALRDVLMQRIESGAPTGDPQGDDPQEER